MSKPENREREFEILEILVVSWNIFRKYYHVIIPLAFAVSLPLNLFSVFIKPELNFTGETGNFKNANSAVILLMIYYIGLIINFLIAIIVKSALDRKKVSVAGLLKMAIKKFNRDLLVNLGTIALFLAVSTAYVFMAFYVFNFFILLLVPVFILMVFWIFALYAFAVKDLNAWQAFIYSYHTVRGRFLKVLLYTIVFGLISFFIQLMLAAPALFLTVNEYILAVYDAVIGVILSYFVVVFTVFFINFDYSNPFKVPRRIKA